MLNPPWTWSSGGGGLERVTGPSTAEVAEAVTTRGDESQGTKGDATSAGMTRGGGGIPAHGERSGEIGAEPPMAGEGPVGRKAGRSAELPGEYTTPVRPARQVPKSVQIARAKVWKLERQKARLLGGASPKKHGRGSEESITDSILDSVSDSIPEGEKEDASLLEGNQDDAGGPPSEVVSKPEPMGDADDSEEEMVTMMTIRFSIPGVETTVVQ